MLLKILLSKLTKTSWIEKETNEQVLENVLEKRGVPKIIERRRLRHIYDIRKNLVEFDV